MSPTVALPIDSIFCDNVNIDLDAELTEPSNYVWQDGSVNPMYTATAAGKYWVEVSNYCGSVSDTMNIGMITTPNADLGLDEVFCGAVSPITVSVGQVNNQEVYTWSDGHNLSDHTLSTVGQHWVQISNKCGIDSDSVTISISPYPIVDLGLDTILCGDFSVSLDAGNPGMDYLWEPYGEATQVIQATEQITYKVTVTNADGCESSDDFTIDGSCVSHAYIPNSFTPNGDNRNETFKPSLINYQDYEMRIFNRWGELLFESFDVNEGWDGTYKGVPVQQGVYLYQIRYERTEDLTNQNVSGLVNVLR
jgi:gliding motility-associated-like protein